MPLITEEELEVVYDALREFREVAAEEMAAQAEEMEVNTAEMAAHNEPNDYGVPYHSPEPFWVGSSSSNPESEDESMPDSNQENEPPANPPQYQDPNSSDPSQEGNGTSESQPEMDIEQYEELDAEGIRNLATMLGVMDADSLERLAQCPQVFHAVSTLVRDRFLNRCVNYLDIAGWHLARRIFLVGSHNASEVGVSTGNFLLPHEWMAAGVVSLFEFMDNQRREMGIEPWETYGCKSFKWRVYYGILVLYLNNTADMAYALLTDNNQAENWTEENQDWLEAVTGAVNAFAETLCEEGEYDPDAAGSYRIGIGR